MENKELLKKFHPANVFIALAAILMLLLGTVYLIVYFVRLQRYEQTNDAQVESYINPVSARAGGYIEKVYFEEHQLVKSGDTLIVLDKREYEAKLQEAQAIVDDAYAQIQVLDAGVIAAQASIPALRNQIDGAKARFVQQQQQIRRYQNLLKEEAATGSEFDQIKAAFDVSNSGYHEAQNNLEATRARIQELISHKALLAADLKRKLVGLTLARLNLSYTVVCAPYTGQMGRKSIQKGQQIQAGQPLVYIVNDQTKWITANFKETQLDGMYNGQTVDIQIDAIPGKTFHGKIVAIAASTGTKFSLLPVDNSTGNFVKIVQRVPVKISFTSTDIAEVKTGMNAFVAVKKTKQHD